MYANSGTARWKRLGFYDINISRGLRDIIAKNDSVLTKLDEIGMYGAEKADEITWVALWNASRKKAEDVNEIFNDVIYRTQVVDSTITRSETMRSKSFFVKSMASFMGEPVATVSMLIGAADELSATRRSGDVEARRAAIGRMKNAAVILGISALAESVVQSVFDAMRDDDDDKDWLEKFRRKFVTNLVDNLNPFKMIPMVKFVIEAVEYIASNFSAVDDFFAKLGYDPYTSAPGTAVTDFVETWGRFFKIGSEKYFKGNDSYTHWSVIKQFLQAVAETTGVPADVALRNIVSPYNLAMDLIDRPQYKLKTYRSGAERQYNMLEAIRNDDAKQLDDLVSQYYGGWTDDARSGVRTAIRSSYYDAEIGKAEAKKYLKTYLGMDEKAAESAVKSWDKNLAKKEQEEG